MQINDVTFTAIEDALWDSFNNELSRERLQAALNGCETVRKSTATDLQLDAARERWSSVDLQIDDDATVSEGDGGYWVQAWVWVKEVDPECETCVGTGTVEDVGPNWKANGGFKDCTKCGGTRNSHADI